MHRDAIKQFYRKIKKVSISVESDNSLDVSYAHFPPPPKKCPVIHDVPFFLAFSSYQRYRFHTIYTIQGARYRLQDTRGKIHNTIYKYSISSTNLIATK